MDKQRFPYASTSLHKPLVLRHFHFDLTLTWLSSKWVFTNNELAKYVEYLKEENKILRARLPGHVHTKPAERERLLKYGKVIGRAIEELMTIVSPSTFYRWVRDEKHGKSRPKNPKGGQRKPKEIRTLFIEIANTTGFGYTRIIGELRKLGIKKVSRQTVRNILKEEGIQPGPDRTSDNWDDFVERHAKTLWAADFFSVKTVTARGLRDMYVLVWLCMTTREVIVSESTLHPNSVWVEKQADLFVDQTAGRDVKPSIVMHDKDTKFTKKIYGQTQVTRRAHQLLAKGITEPKRLCGMLHLIRTIR